MFLLIISQCVILHVHTLPQLHRILRLYILWGAGQWESHVSVLLSLLVA